MRTLIIYVTHVYHDNVRMFLDRGVDPVPDVTYVLVNNGPVYIPNIPSHVRVIRRPNIGHDFGGISAALWTLAPDGLPDYDRFIFVNSTVEGPYLPTWAKNHWSVYFNRLITDHVKLVGISTNVHRGQYHVQSMLLCLDRVGLALAIKHGIYSSDIHPLPKQHLIEQKEVKLSKVILEAGYGIDCTQTLKGGINYNQLIHPDEIPWRGYNHCLGQDIDPIESIFIKNTNPTSHLSQEVSRVYLACQYKVQPSSGQEFRLSLVGTLSRQLISLALGIVVSMSTGKTLVCPRIDGLNLVGLMDTYYKLSVKHESVPPTTEVESLTCEELATVLDQSHLQFKGQPVGPLGGLVGNLITALIPPQPVAGFPTMVQGPVQPGQLQLTDSLTSLGQLFYCQRLIADVDDLGYVGRAICQTRRIPVIDLERGVNES